MLRLTGRLSDGWTPSHGYAPPDQIPQMQRIIEQSISATRRNSNEVRRNYNLAGIVSESDSKIVDHQERAVIREQDGLLVGSVDFWVDTIVKFYKDLRMDSFTFWPANESAQEVELFANKIVPRMKEEIKKLAIAKNS